MVLANAPLKIRSLPASITPATAERPTTSRSFWISATLLGNDLYSMFLQKEKRLLLTGAQGTRLPGHSSTHFTRMSIWFYAVCPGALPVNDNLAALKARIGPKSLACRLVAQAYFSGEHPRGNLVWLERLDLLLGNDLFHDLIQHGIQLFLTQFIYGLCHVVLAGE